MLTLLKLLEFLINKIKYRNFQQSVVFINDKFIFINKPPDISINSNDECELTVQTYMKYKYPQYSNQNLGHEFYFPHRLDFATSGILCLPKDKVSCMEVSQLFQHRLARKYYVAVLRGILSKNEVVVDKPIGECVYYPEWNRMCTSNYPCCANPRTAVTCILKLEVGLYEGYPGTKVLIRTVTGKRHQIRVHCNSLGHTIVGDYTYSLRKDNKPNRMFLHSVRLVIPGRFEWMDVKTEDPFTTEHFKEWVTMKTFVKLSNYAYSKVNKLANDSLNLL